MNVSSLSARDTARTGASATVRLARLGLAAALLLALPVLAQAQTFTVSQPGAVVGEVASTLTPGGPKVALNHFQVVSTGTSTVSSFSVTMPAGSAALLSSISIENSSACNQPTPYGTLLTPATDVAVVAVTGLSVTTTVTPLWVCIRPRAHTAMAVPPGGTVAVTGRISASTVAVGTVAASTDVAGLARTIDNTSPLAPVLGAVTVGDQRVNLTWTNPVADFYEVLVLQRSGTAVTDVPVEGVEYAPFTWTGSAYIPTLIGSSTVIYAGSATAFAATGLTNTTGVYHFRIFARDLAGNWSATGPVTGPHTPLASTVTTVGPGTESAASSRFPGGLIADLDAFTLVSGGTSDTLTAATVTLSPANAYSVVGTVAITSNDGSVTYGTVTNPTSNSVPFTFTTPALVATTTATQYRVRITPRLHSAMPGVPGAQYAVQGVVSSITCTKPTVLSDTNLSSVVTIDNASPGNGAWGTTSPGSTTATLNWTNPALDYANTVILRSAAPITDAPAEGSTPALNAPVGASFVAYTGTALTTTVTGLSNGTPYYFKHFARDAAGNYAPGVQVGPLIPGAGTTTIGSTAAGTLVPVISVVNPAPGARVAPGPTALFPDYRGFKVQVRVTSPSNATTPATPITAVVVRLNGANQAPPAVLSTKYGSTTLGGIWEHTLTLAAGTYTIDALATNGSGTVTSSPVSVTVQALGVKGDGNLLVRDNSASLCTDCHAIATHSSESVGSSYGSWSTSCRDCHTPHGTNNLYLVAPQITAAPRGASAATAPRSVAFSDTRALGTGDLTTARATASYVNTDASGPCQVCHTLTKYYRADGSSPSGPGHQTGTRCTSCHGHTAGMAINCTQCHGDALRVATPGLVTDPRLTAAPPRGSGGELATTTRAVGAHQAHLNAARWRTNPLGCVDCHPANNSHEGLPVEMAWSPLASGLTAAVPLTPSFDGTSCSSTWCHGAGLRAGASITPPVWTGGPTQANCGTCHGSPPPSPHPGAPAGCAVCHAGYETTGLTVAARNTHIDGRLQVPSLTSCTACHGTAGRPIAVGLVGTDPQIEVAPPISASGSTAPEAHMAHINLRSVPVGCIDCHPTMPFPGDPSHPDGTRVISLSSSALGNQGGAIATYSGYPGGTCASTYCHGGTFSAATKGSNTAPVWTDVLTCGSCHGAPPADPRHRSVAALTECIVCHDQTVTAAGGINVAASMHVDGSVQTNIQDYGCEGCHGTPNLVNGGNGVPWFESAPPADASGASATSAVSVGTHRVHVNGTRSRTVECLECHTGSEAFEPYSENPVSMWTHADGLVDLRFGPEALGFRAQQGGRTADYVRNSATSATCSSTYCHGTGAPSWTAVGTLGCTACHASPPALPHPASTACGTCHTGYTATTIPATASLTHVDGHPDTSSIGCTSCHGAIASNPGATSSTPLLAAPGVSPTAFDLSGTTPIVPTTVTYGAHAAHLNQATFTTAPIACASCHAVPLDGNILHGTDTGTGGARATVTWSQLATGTVPVQAPPVAELSAKGKGPVTAAAVGGSGGPATTDALWSFAAVPSYSRTGAVGCTATYCHGEFRNGQIGKTVVWATDITLNCNSCHGTVGAAMPATLPGGTHPTGNVNCGVCHTGYTGTTANLAVHINGSMDVTVVAGCASCHGTAGRVSVTGTFGPVNTANNLLAVPPNDTLSAATGVRVGPHISHAVPQTPAQQIYKPVLCSECHGVAVNSYTSGHGNSVTDLTFANATAANLGGIIPGFVQNTAPTADTCTTYCHGASFTVAQRGVTTTWSWNTGVAVACNSCHASPPTDPVHTSVPKPSAATVCVACHASVVNAGGTIVFTGTGAAATTLHIDGTRQTSTATCYSCHGTLAAGNAAPPVATNGNTLTTQPKVGAHQRHLVGVRLRGTAIACGECHTVPTLMNHATGSPNVAWGALSTNGGLVPTPAAGAVAAAWETTPTCTNYCHGQEWAANATYRGAVTAPSWTGTAAQAACNSCHLAPPTSAIHPVPYPTTTNCSSCHAGYNCVTSNLAACTVNLTTHLNGVPDSSGGTCSSCHGTAGRVSVTGTFGPVNTANNLLAVPPNDTAAAATGVRVGPHLSHAVPQTPAQQIYKPVLCSECHGLAVNSYTSGHTNSATDLTFANATAANLGGIIPGIVQNTAPTADTCTTYCHGASFTVAQQGVTTTWSWNTGVAVACNSCHASPPTDPVHTSVPKPSAATVCVACHASVVNAGGTIVFTGTGVAATTLHIDGTRQTSTATCYSCHGTLAAGNAAPPVATNGNTLTTQPKVGAHQKHLTGTALRSTRVVCGDCHTVPALMNHATGSPNVAWSALATTGGVIPTPAAGAVAAAWETTPTCTNYCHGAKWAANANYLGATPAPTWTGTAAMVACDDCHRAPPTSSAHVGVTSTKNCQDCHPGYNCTTGSMATCTVNAANHINGAYEPAVMTCSSCHGSVTNFAPPLATNGSTTGVKVGGHQAHLVGTTQRATAMACGDCHTVPTLQTHSNAVVGFTWNALATTGSLVPTPSAATGLGAATTPTLTTWEATPTCTNYCHGQKWAADAVYRGTITAPNWNSGVTQQACGTCHRVPRTTPTTRRPTPGPRTAAPATPATPAW
ncbi:MAG: CxxxxCH/CxxCH domain-containing protein [Anaeromyxobacter sp.]|nr:CxxxxCH/CxxCH domain-containing protein [Anaeromyxobacter sp.]